MQTAEIVLAALRIGKRCCFPRSTIAVLESRMHRNMQVRFRGGQWKSTMKAYSSSPLSYPTVWGLGGGAG